MTIWSIYPFPTLYSTSNSLGKFENGSLVGVPLDCLSCPTQPCLTGPSTKPGQIYECRYGYHFIPLDDVRRIVGVVVPDYPGASRRLKGRGRNEPKQRVTAMALGRAVLAARNAGPGMVADLEIATKAALDGIKSDPAAFSALAQQLRKDFDETLNQSHDFLQLVKLVKGYAETLLQEKHPGLSTTDAANQSPVEGAIYYSTEMMLVKMDSMIFLTEINRAYGSETEFQIHPFFLKYVRIYKWQADQKNLTLHVTGSSHTSCVYNSMAIGAVIQGLLDNLVKYAPAGSEADINFEEHADGVKITLTSLGPKIAPDELEKIFLPGVRAKAAKGAASSGLGLGLATARQVSDALGLRLAVSQAPGEDPKYRHRYSTTFSIWLEAA